jgi:hypothetical protein
MTPREIETEIVQLLKSSYKQKLLAEFPPASQAKVEEVNAKSIKHLGTALEPDYRQLVRIVNGGGYDTCFYGTHTRPFKMLGRELTSLGIVEQNLQLREREMIDTSEIAYAAGESCVFLPSGSGGWVGRNITTRIVEWRFASFTQLLRKVYGGIVEGGPHGPYPGA